MEKPLFDKAILWTDIHYGLKQNSKSHNLDCIKFTEWMIEEAKKENIKTAIFLGDYFHSRNSINVSTLDYGLKGIQLINEYFDDVYFIVGNHDCYNKNTRTVTSVSIANEFENVHVINEITDIGQCTFVPFLMGDEWKTLQTKNPKYYFGHFELPGYKLNSLVEMPDHGRETDDIFNCDILFSGHFHKRQIKNLSNGTQVMYIGNCFPHNFSDAWDDARGCAILEWGETPIFKNWPDAPKYRTANMSDLLEDPRYYLEAKTTLKVILDIDLTIEEIIFIKDTYIEYFNLAEFSVVHSKDQDRASIDEDNNELQAESVDSIVAEQINNIDSNTLKKDLLLEIYNNL